MGTTICYIMGGGGGEHERQPVLEAGGFCLQTGAIGTQLNSVPTCTVLDGYKTILKKLKYFGQTGLRIRITSTRILSTLIRIRIQLFTLMGIRILLLVKWVGICD
jgi:hypothetical protein